MNKDKINKEKKEKAKKIAFKILHGVSYALSTCFIATCIVACASSSNKKSDNSPKSLIQYRIDGESESQSESESVSYPIYDDENSQITLSSYQVNNYSWNNFNSVIDNILDVETDISSLEYHDLLFDFDSIESSYIIWSNQGDTIYFVFDVDTFNSLEGFELEKNYVFIYIYSGYGLTTFSDNLVIKVTNNYSNVKQAIEFDIQANESPTSDIFTAISDTITNFVIALNSGITAIVGLFWNSTSSALTPLGVLTTIVVGTALVFFGFKLVMRLIRLHR